MLIRGLNAIPRPQLLPRTHLELGAMHVGQTTVVRGVDMVVELSRCVCTGRDVIATYHAAFGTVTCLVDPAATSSHKAGESAGVVVEDDGVGWWRQNSGSAPVTSGDGNASPACWSGAMIGVHLTV